MALSDGLGLNHLGELVVLVIRDDIAISSQVPVFDPSHLDREPHLLVFGLDLFAIHHLLGNGTILLAVVALALPLGDPVLVDLLLRHLECLDHLCRVGIGTDAVHVNLVLLDAIHKEVSWVKPDNCPLVAADFDGEHDRSQLLVDQAHKLGEVAVLHHHGEPAAVDLVVHTLHVLSDPGLLITVIAIFVLA